MSDGRTSGFFHTKAPLAADALAVHFRSRVTNLLEARGMEADALARPGEDALSVVATVGFSVAGMPGAMTIAVQSDRLCEPLHGCDPARAHVVSYARLVLAFIAETIQNDLADRSLECSIGFIKSFVVERMADPHEDGFPAATLKFRTEDGAVGVWLDLDRPIELPPRKEDVRPVSERAGEPDL